MAGIGIRITKKISERYNGKGISVGVSVLKDLHRVSVDKYIVKLE
jgi:hypothetical protein